MSFPVISRSAAPLLESDAAALLLLVPDTATSPDALDAYPGLAEALTAVGFTGAVSSFLRVYVPGLTEKPLAVAGVGKQPSASAVRDAAGTALRCFTGVESIGLGLAEGLGEHATAAAEGAVFGGYRFEGYRSDPGKPRAKAVTIHSNALAEDEVARVTVLGENLALVKDLVAEPAEWLSPAVLAERAVESLTGLPVSAEVLDEGALAEGGFGGILGVGQGSDRPPRLVRLDYAPAGAASHLALVGKGITFDTGGLSLKPAASMVGMKLDMAGAATALAAVRVIAALALPIRVTAWLCIADNMPSGRATRPGDVLRMLGGTTVEVLNTDAEGRLVLGDGLVAASRENPDVIVDIATLTGAMITALGNRHTGVMGDEETVDEYLTAAESVDEPAWPLPLPAHMKDELESPIADLRNAKIGSAAGGALFAGLFLQHFVGRRGEDEDAPRIPWVHLDIAGSSVNEVGAYGFTDKGPTGATLRSIVAFAEQRAGRGARA